MSIIKLKGVVLNTKGDGYWSRVSKPVPVTALRLGYVAEGDRFGELRAYFTNDWDTRTDGLIYTDSRFLSELRFLIVDRLGFSQAAAQDVDYSEQGMQGDDYVSLDVGAKFLAEFLPASSA